MLERLKIITKAQVLLKANPILGILGPRQVGKTTMARHIAAKWPKVHWFDLERPADLARLEDSSLALEALEGLVVIDEIQRRPELFAHLRYLADRPGLPARFLILGSTDPQLLSNASESLAGRIAYLKMDGFGLDEARMENMEQLWLRGGFPLSYLAKSDEESLQWRAGLVETYLTRDLAALAPGVEPAAMRRFWTMLAHYHGQIFNASELSRAFGVSHHTVRRYLDRLSGTFMVRQLQPFYENLARRQVKAPKIYLRDTGLLHFLLGVGGMEDLLSHPKVGASWEGLVVDEILRAFTGPLDQAYFWAAHSGPELDLLVLSGQRRFGFEVKRASAPRLSVSMKSVIKDLKLDALWVVHAGLDAYPLAENAQALPLSLLHQTLKNLKT